VNAAFRTRHSDINVNIAIVGPGNDVLASSRDMNSGGKVKGRVMAWSRHGNIEVNLFEIPEGCCAVWNVSTRKGNIIALFALSFDGMVTLRNRRGSIQLLPGFAQYAHVMRETDRETVIGLPSSLLPYSGNEPYSMPIVGIGDDACLVGTPTGPITLGLSGVDRVGTHGGEAGFSKVLGGYVQVGAKMFEGTL